MAEEPVEQEGLPIISNPFPISEKSALTAFHNLSLEENPTGAQTEANKEMGILDKTNPDVLTFVVKMLTEFKPKEHADQMFWGALITNQALREEAWAQGGGVLPKFTQKFVQKYHNEEVQRHMAERKDSSPSQSITEVANQLNKQHIVRFENMEPVFSRIAREKLGVKPDWRREQDFRYLGIVDHYFIFREGYKDPKNFEH